MRCLSRTGGSGGHQRPRPRHWLGCLLAATLVISGCSARPAPGNAAGPLSGSSSAGSPDGSPDAPSSSSPAASPTARSGGASKPAGSSGVPRFDHVVVAVFENHGFDNVIGSSSAPYLNQLAGRGALLTNSHGVTHPSEPNYLALFSGSTQGLTDDSCPRDFSGTGNLASQLSAAGRSFTGYSEGLPSVGYRGCGGGDRYARKHNPWVDFTAVPADRNRPLADFPADFAALPTVSFVVPNLCSDMHDCPVSQGDSWAQAHLDGYARWAATHNSLLIVTWDEDENTGGSKSDGGQIPTVLAGDHVRPGRYGEAVDHYRILRTVEAAYGLSGLGTAGARAPITDLWR